MEGTDSMQVIRKSCPRCHGDVARVDDIGDTYYSCVQCGHVIYQLAAARVPVRLAPAGSEPARPRAA
jgi:transcription initiation factor TFIIIB Brf1 subunit/transcription initiation factor TFIIB